MLRPYIQTHHAPGVVLDGLRLGPGTIGPSNDAADGTVHLHVGHGVGVRPEGDGRRAVVRAARLAALLLIPRRCNREEAIAWCKLDVERRADVGAGLALHGGPVAVECEIPQLLRALDGCDLLELVLAALDMEKSIYNVNIHKITRSATIKAKLPEHRRT